MRSVRLPGPTSTKRHRRRRPRVLALLAALALTAGLAGLQAGSAAAATSARGAPAAASAQSATAKSARSMASQLAKAARSSALQSQRPRLRPVVRNAIKHDTSQPLRSLKAARIAPSRHIKVIPLHMPPHPVVGGKAITGGPLKLSRAGPVGVAAQPRTADIQRNVLNNSMPGFQQNFEGVSNVNGVLPPDTQGAAGPNDYVQMINLSFAVYNKQGTLLYGPVPNTTLWQGFGGPCETFNGFQAGLEAGRRGWI
jgi:hypothetical protein